MELKALEALISQDINTIPDLPDYKAPPSGKYRLKAQKIGEKKLGEHPALQIVWEVVGVHELANPETPIEDQVVPTNLFTESFFFTKQENFEMTLGALKKKFAPLAEVAGSTNLKDLLTYAEEKEFDCTIIQRINKTTTPPTLNSNTRDLELAVA